MEEEIIQDVLAERYASDEMKEIWTRRNKVRQQRLLWIAVMVAQRECGLDIPTEAISAYEAAVDTIDIESIKRRERVTKHDVKAEIEEYNAVAGYQLIHQGMTSRDLTDNVEQLQIRQSLQLVRNRTVALLDHFHPVMSLSQALYLCARTHNVAAQVTTLGKRFAMWAEELIIAFELIEYVLDNFPLRGMKGPVGTQQDMLDLLKDAEKVERLEQRIATHLGFAHVLKAVGQVYPRSLDFQVVGTLLQLASAPANMAKTLRLMAGHNLAQEGFSKGQTGSSAMPHKMNARTSERIGSLTNVLRGYLMMSAGLVGDQWNEGDVSCSVTRRVSLQGSFFALDGIYESAMTVLREITVSEPMIRGELLQQTPFVSSTKLLMAAIQKGAKREDMHERIKHHLTTAVQQMREAHSVDIVAMFDEDAEFPLNAQEVSKILESADIGNAFGQTGRIISEIKSIVEIYPDAADYAPAPIL
jgi:adenylosuccinate lyase